MKNMEVCDRLISFLFGLPLIGPEIRWTDRGTEQQRDQFLCSLDAYRQTAERIYQGNHGGGIPVASAMLEHEGGWYREIVARQAASDSQRS